MNGTELKALRKGMAFTQEGLAKRLGVSRKTINELEGGGEVDARTAMAVRQLADREKVTEDTFWVQASIRNTYIVARRTVREIDRPDALYWANGQTMLYGEFKRRIDAYRWCAALRLANNPRNTRKLMRKRAAEYAERQALEEATA